MPRSTGHGWRLAVLACALATFGATSVAAAQQADSAAASASRLLVVPNSPEGRAALSGSSARSVAEYGAFVLVEAVDADVGRLVAAGGEVRDDMREVKIGAFSFDPAKARTDMLGKLGLSPRIANKGGYGLAVVQYVGPLKDSWIAAVRAAGAEVVTYMAQNAQLVSGDSSVLAALAELPARHRFIRAIVPYTTTDKMLPGLSLSGLTEVVISTVAGKAGAAARAEIERVSTRRGEDVAVAGIVQQRVRLNGAGIGALAELGGVVAIEPDIPPTLLDERAGRILSGALDGSFQPVLGGGYRAYLINKGFAQQSPVIIDITDEGIDKGVVPVPAGSHPDFFHLGNASNASRIVYAQENTAADTDARDCGGHGTNVASIATGFNALTGATVEDAQGFNYGLGIQPFGRVGATKIFNCAGSFDVTTSLTALHSAAYGLGARISNNSWGAAVGGAYAALSREFDALVRDAQPGVPGNQQFTEVVSAGNSGSAGNSIGSPATGKNVIAVGASENVRAIGGSDGCGVPDTGADSARDVIDFSSRGPTDDGRTKPDIVAPGTHMTGARPQTGADFNGGGTCNPSFPADSTIYDLVSGTSQAAPVVTGFASLIHTWYRAGLGGGSLYPSPAMTKALMINTATDMVGGNDGAAGVNPSVPTQVQGWGRVTLRTLLDGTSRRVIDQTTIFTNTGGSINRYFTVASASRQLRVTLVWTDAPGPTTGNSYVNDLDLQVTAGGKTYKGNVFSGGRSVPGGSFDLRNNVENVFLPAGVTGAIKVRIIARNIVGDGVPGIGDATDQDFALVVSNVTGPVASLAVLTDAGTTANPLGDGDAFLEPGEPFTLRQRLQNVGNANAASISGTLSANASEAAVTQASSAWPNLAAGASANNNPLFGATVKPALACGDFVDLSINVSVGGSQFSVPVRVRTGRPGTTAISVAATDVPKSIPDNNQTGVTSNFTVPGSGFVSGLNVRIDSLTHTWVGDLQIDLTSPAGTVVRLFDRHGGSGDNFTGTVFNDNAAVAIAAGTPPYTGGFKPFQPLSAFVGEPVGGTWKLTVRDLAGADVGTLNNWRFIRRLYTCD